MLESTEIENMLRRLVEKVSRACSIKKPSN